MDKFDASLNEPAQADEPMGTAQSPRRSGRSRKANVRYAGTDWSKETLRALRESSESSNPTSIDTNVESPGPDHDFEERASPAAIRNVSEDEDNLSMISGSSHDSRIAGTAEGDAENDVNDVNDVNEDGQEDITKRPRYKQPVELHSRGLTSVERGRSVRGGAWQAVWGPKLEDLEPMLRAKEQWLYKREDVTLPSIGSIHACLTEWIENERNLYAQMKNCEIPSAVKQHQRVDHISFEEAQRRLFLVDGVEHRIVLGPWSQQQLYDLPFLKSINLSKGWRKSDDESNSSYHSGWLLNVGQKPRCMAWSPCQEREQYLALVCHSTPEQRQAVPKVESKTSPAFSPSTEYPSSVQIWKFSVGAKREASSSMDHTNAPSLVQLMGFNFGEVQRMAWAPEPRYVAEQQAQTHLGMLTLLTSDGRMRLIHVPKHDSNQSVPSCLRVTTASIQLDPAEGSIFTCFTFASPTDLIIGTSLGSIQIYNISQPTNPEVSLEPYFTFQIDSTYITSLSVLDGEYSHFLASTSATGDVQFTDLRSPVQDQACLVKARMPSRNLVYNSHCRTFITTVDGTGATEPRGNAQTSVIALTSRYFYASMLISKFPEGGGTATALAGSPLHPFILMGSSSGNVWSQNLLRRILPTGKSGGPTDGGAWVQKVVEHEWIPQPTTTKSSNDQPMTDHPIIATKKPNDLYHTPPVRPGTSRMHHGFVPEKLDLSNTGNKKRKIPAAGPDGEGAVLLIYEEEQAVAAIEWNVNPIAAGWCAIGWGSGVVLVTDLSHDAG